MAEILDAPPSGQPGTHTLVVGVSRYPYTNGPDATSAGTEFGLPDLTSAAGSASQFAGWLLDEYRNPDAPLQSLRVLLSPSDGEVIHPSVAARLPDEHSASLEAVKRDLLAFRQACCGSPDSVIMVYIAGHGVQLSKHRAIVLLDDFGAPDQLNKLERAIDTTGCHDGFDADGYPRHQFWFVDACRQETRVAKKFEKLSGGPLTLDEPKGSVESTPMFLASSTREAAFAEIGGTSLFSQALLWALRIGAATGPDAKFCADWHVRTSGLLDAVRPRVSLLAGQHGAQQHVDVTGRPGSGIAHRFHSAPDVELAVTLTPDEATDITTAQLLHRGRTLITSVDGWPLIGSVPAGLYSLELSTEPPFLSYDRPLSVSPPQCQDEVSVAP